jgi:predicted dehydrogenase
VARVLSVAVIGVGVAGTRHLERLLRRDDAVVVGVVDSRPEQRERVRRTVGVAAHACIRELLGDTCPDAVFVCLPPDQHGRVEHECLDAGVPMLVEKPIGIDLATPDAVAAHVARSGVPAVVGYQWRQLSFLPEVALQLAGRSVHLVVGSWMGPPAAAAWWGDVRMAGGQLVEQATHLVDLAVSLNGPFEVVSAVASRERHGHASTGFPLGSSATGRFANGAAGAFLSTCSLSVPHRRSLDLLADDLAVSITDSAATCVTSRSSHRWVHDPPDPLVREQDAFLELVRTGTCSRPLVPYAEALVSHRAAVAMEALMRPADLAER